MTPRSKGLRPAPRPKHPLQITTRTLKEPDFKFELLPLHSPLLRQSLLVSFPPLIDMLKFSGYPYLIRGQSLKTVGVVGQRQCEGFQSGINFTTLEVAPDRHSFSNTSARTRAQYQATLEGCNDARTGMPPGIPRGAMCVQRFDDSLNSAIHITYRISLRSSSMPEPRDPLLKVLVYFCFCSDCIENQSCDGLWRALAGGEADRG